MMPSGDEKKEVKQRRTFMYNIRVRKSTPEGSTPEGTTNPCVLQSSMDFQRLVSVFVLTALCYSTFLAGLLSWAADRYRSPIDF